jgi:hypothetical protein
MPFVLIQGTFHLVGRTQAGNPTGFEPDGDSVVGSAAPSGLATAPPPSTPGPDHPRAAGVAAAGAHRPGPRWAGQLR